MKKKTNVQKESLQEWLERKAEPGSHFLIPKAINRVLKLRLLFQLGGGGVLEERYPRGPLPFGGPPWEPCLVKFLKTGEWDPEP